MTADEPCAAGPRPPDGADVLLADAALGSVPADAQPDADQAITAIYGTEYRSLVRLAAVLVGDVGIAEEVVQDSFVAMYSAWSRLRDRDKALA
ncbi:MAG TPA: sigma factor, partial [Streptosporangiaceae bacterium]|nr:sigma factor [Streptosporangiaceae bacterium]